MKKCPFCAEEIQDDAIKCRYCQSDLSHSVSSQVDYDYGRALSSEEKSYLANLPRKHDLSKNAMGDAQCVNKKNNDKIIVGIIFGLLMVIVGVMDEITNVKNTPEISKDNVKKTQNVEVNEDKANVKKDIKKEAVNNTIKSSETDSCISKYENQGYSQTEAESICEAAENLMWATQ